MPDPVVAPPTSPVITTGGGDPAPKTPAPDTSPVTTQTPEAPEVFDFKFDGDDEVYSHKEDTDRGAESDTAYDASKPFDPKIEEALKESPDALKGIKQAHYELRQYKAAGFKTPGELKAFKDRIEALGGADGVESSIKETTSRIAQLHNGDEAALDWLSQEHPEGMMKLAVPYLNRLSKAAPAVWAREMGKVFMATLLQPNGQGLSSLAAFNQLYDAVGDNAAAKKLLNQIADTINSVDKAAKSNPEETRRGGNDEESRKLNVERHTVYLQKVNLSAGPLIDSAASQAIKSAFKGRNISPEVQREIMADIKKGFNELQKKDETFQKNASDLLRSQDTERFLKVLKSAIARNMPRAALREARKYKGLSGDTQTRKLESQARTESAGASVGSPQEIKYTGPMVRGGPDPAVIGYAEMRALYGRKGTDDMLSQRKFLKKGDSKTIFFW